MTNGLNDYRARFDAGTLGKHEYIEAMHGLHRLLFDYAHFLRGSMIARIEIDDEGVLFTTRAGVRFRLDPVDRRQAPVEALNFRRFEAHDEEMLLRLIEPPTTVFDVGANIGWYTLHLARANPGGRVFAFEPVPSTFARLRENVALNDIDNITLFNHGLSHREETLVFYVYPEGSGGSSSVNVSGLPSVREIHCRVRPLDAVVAELGVGPDLLKIDVEGAELFVLKGALEGLRRHRPLIFCEMLRKWAERFGYHPNQIIDLLGSTGYTCYEAVAGQLRPLPRIEDSTTATNFFFLHRERHQAIRARLVGGA